MSGRGESDSQDRRGHYDANYGNFQTRLYGDIRQEAFGEDIGQNSWLTVDEQDRFLNWLELSPGKKILDVACGAGGPALRIAGKTGCSVVGVDIHEDAILTAGVLAAQRGMSSVAEFRLVDARQQLPFHDGIFDTITCIDAINHLPDRTRVIADWARLLKVGGRLLFTDATIVTGPLTNAEIEVRSSAGFYLFVPSGYNEGVLEGCNLKMLIAEDRTENTAKVATGRKAARASRSEALRSIEGNEFYERQQEFLETAARLAQEKRLSRYVYVSSLT